MGTGTTVPERRLVWALTALATAAFTAVAWSSDVAWAWWQWLVVLAIAIDVLGGATANALGGAKRLYHQPLPAGASVMQRAVHHPVGFAAVHLQPFVLALVLPGGHWLWAAALYATTLGGTVAVYVVPLYLKRPLAFGLAAIGVVALTAVSAPVGMAWFAPVFVLKLVLAHCVPERAFLPGETTARAVALPGSPS